MLAAVSQAKTYDLDDYLNFSVGSLKYDFHGEFGTVGDEVVSLDTLADNLDFLCRVVGGEDIRWLMLTNEVATVPHNRAWKAATVMAEVESIAMGTKLVKDHRIDTHGFVGTVDYVLMNLLKTRTMVIVACFDDERDAVLVKMRD